MRNEILELSRKFFEKEKSKQTIIPGENYIPPAGKVLDGEDLVNLIDSSLDMWLTAGRFANQFEENFAAFFGLKHCLLTNSGSSANLLAFTALTSPRLKDRRLLPGDEVITVAAGFPTTVNPIIQNNCIPVFVDVELATYQVDVNLIESAITKKTKAIMIAHTLGNTFNLKAVKDICSKHNLWLIEDCCDAVGAKYDGKSVGTFGDLATTSFYPAHHITMGEGGAVLTNNKELKIIVESFRDWGRDCFCPPGCDNTCRRRFSWKLGELPDGYDHKYTYGHIGYNLKVTDMQAAIGCSQLKKLPSFVEKRNINFNYLKNKMKELKLDKYLILPEATKNSEPSWFGFPLSLREESDDLLQKTRNELIQYLENNKIGTRLLFGGNLTKQPLYTKEQYKVASKLTNTDYIMNNTFWIGVFPALNSTHMDYIAEKLLVFFNSSTTNNKSV